MFVATKAWLYEKAVNNEKQATQKIDDLQRKKLEIDRAIETWRRVQDQARAVQASYLGHAACAEEAEVLPFTPPEAEQLPEEPVLAAAL